MVRLQQEVRQADLVNFKQEDSHATCKATIGDLRQKLATIEWQKRGFGGLMTDEPKS